MFRNLIYDFVDLFTKKTKTIHMRVSSKFERALSAAAAGV